MWRRSNMTEDDLWEFVCMYKWVKSTVDLFYFVWWLIACLMLLKPVKFTMIQE